MRQKYHRLRQMFGLWLMIYCLQITSSELAVHIMTVLVSDHKEAPDARHVWPRRGESQGSAWFHRAGSLQNFV